MLKRAGNLSQTARSSATRQLWILRTLLGATETRMVAATAKGIKFLFKTFLFPSHDRFRLYGIG